MVRLTDCSDMTIAVDLEVKPSCVDFYAIFSEVKCIAALS